MRILGLITILPNRGDNSIVWAGEATTLPGLDLGRCVEWFDDSIKFVLQDCDIDSLTSRLVEARKQGRFARWSMSWDLCDNDGVVMNAGLISEDEETGAIVNRSPSSFLRDQIDRQQQ